jgi:hypothetical protein
MAAQRGFWIPADYSAPNYFYRSDRNYEAEIVQSQHGGIIISLLLDDVYTTGAFDSEITGDIDWDIIWEREYTPYPSGWQHEEHDIVGERDKFGA